MGKLIDTDDLKLRLKNLHLLATSGYGAEEVVTKILDEMPEGIVRCDECVYRNKDVCMMLSYRDLVSCKVYDHGYCSFGERME